MLYSICFSLSLSLSVLQCIPWTCRRQFDKSVEDSQVPTSLYKSLAQAIYFFNSPSPKTLDLKQDVVHRRVEDRPVLAGVTMYKQ